MKKNNNISTIYHHKHDQLRAICGSPAKALFLSKCIYWWQISTYKIDESDKIWFTRTREELAQQMLCSLSTIDRYIRDLCKAGLIEKVVKKRYVKKAEDKLPVIHLRITDKLLCLLKTKEHTANQSSKNTTERKNFAQNDDSQPVKMTSSYINKENYDNNSNTISKNHAVSFVEKKQRTETTFKIEQEFGESITDELKKTIKGMLYNVLKKRGQRLEGQDRLFAEVVFSITNPEQFKNCKSVQHKINAIAKVIEKGQWQTPKGFFNHSHVGADFKQKDEQRLKKLEHEKYERALEGVECPKQIAEIKQRLSQTTLYEAQFARDTHQNKSCDAMSFKKLTSRQSEVEHEIFTQGQYLRDCENLFAKGEGGVTQALIDSVIQKLTKLYDEQERLEVEINQQTAELRLTA